MNRQLTWIDAYEIGRLLHQQYPEVNLSEVSLGKIQEMTKELPEFSDDITIPNDQLLMAILCEWLEEEQPI